MKNYENYRQIMHNADYEFANVYEITSIFGFVLRKRLLTVCVAKRAPYDMTGFVILTDGSKSNQAQAYGINLARHVAELRAALENEQNKSPASKSTDLERADYIARYSNAREYAAAYYDARLRQTVTINGED